CYHHNSGWTF
nr:immunoglobulin light chain junction region [Macaca mulatta]